MHWNWFMVAIGVQYVAAMMYEVYRGHTLLALVYFCYGVSAVALGGVKE